LANRGILQLAMLRLRQAQTDSLLQAWRGNQIFIEFL